MDEPVVFIQVEWSLAERALQAIDALRSGAPIRDQRDEEEPSVVVGDSRWTASKVATLAGHVSYKGVLALLDALAAAPDTWVPKSAVEAEHGITPVQLRNELGAFSKLNRKLFGTTDWPMEYRKTSGAFSYRMPKAIADSWVQARGES